MKKIALVLVAVLMVMMVGACDGEESKPAETMPTTAVTEHTTTTATTAPKEKDPDIAASEGQHKVGVDIPEGIYLLIANSTSRSGYFEVSSDGSTILINDNFDKCSYIKVLKGEYLKLSNSYALDANRYSPKFESIVGISEGMYFVGRDIKAGEYKLNGTRSSGKGYYEVLDSRHDIYENDFFTGTSYVVVEEGVFLKLSGAEVITAP